MGEPLRDTAALAWVSRGSWPLSPTLHRAPPGVCSRPHGLSLTREPTAGPRTAAGASRLSRGGCWENPSSQRCLRKGAALQGPVVLRPPPSQEPRGHGGPSSCSLQKQPGCWSRLLKRTGWEGQGLLPEPQASAPPGGLLCPVAALQPPYLLPPPTPRSFPDRKPCFRD